jgi:hypothetical protein
MKDNFREGMEKKEKSGGSLKRETPSERMEGIESIKVPLESAEENMRDLELRSEAAATAAEMLRRGETHPTGYVDTGLPSNIGRTLPEKSGSPGVVSPPRQMAAPRLKPIDRNNPPMSVKIEKMEQARQEQERAFEQIRNPTKETVLWYVYLLAFMIHTLTLIVPHVSFPLT